MSIVGQANNEGQLLLKLILVREAALIDARNHLIQQVEDIDLCIIVADPGVLEVGRGRLELGELLQVLDRRDARVLVKGD